MSKQISAMWSRAGLTVRVFVTPSTSAAVWGITIDEARSMVRELTIAIEQGQRHLNDLEAKAAHVEPKIDPRNGAGHP